MISFEHFLMDDQTPIYQQLVLFIRRSIASGAVKPGEELPSRRMLSALLGVNPNTVQKAYRLLEDEGLIESRTGAKSCIALGTEQLKQVRSEVVEAEARSLLTALRQTGIGKKEALRLIDALWEEDEA